MTKEKVILIENVEKLGKKNDIVEVNKSYAENFLIPQKKAVKMKNEGLDYLKKEKKKKEDKEKKKKEDLDFFLKVLESFNLTFKLKKQRNIVFGSVKSKDIIKSINEKLKNENSKIKINEKNLINFSKIESEGIYWAKLKIKSIEKLIKIKVIFH